MTIHGRIDRHRTPEPASAASLRKRRERIRSMHLGGAGGFTTCRRLSVMTDDVLASTFRRSAYGSPLAVVALGGYGRRELSFGSDIDTMVLSESRRGSRQMISYYHAVLQFGFDVGHSYRTIDDCMDLRSSAFDAWLSLLDARFVCGDRSIFRTFVGRMKDGLRTESTQSYQRVLDLSERRHKRYGRSAKLLEPNIKNSSGGLRDAHSVLWLLRLSHPHIFGREEGRPSLRLMADDPTLRTLFPARFLRDLRKAIGTLVRIRHQMHLHAGTLHDILEFSSQDPIAKSLGYRSTGAVSSVERFMREYYDAAHTVADLHTRVVDWTADRLSRRTGGHRTKKLTEELQVKGSKILLAPDTRLSTSVLLQAYAHRIEHSFEFDFSLEDAIHRHLRSLRAIRSRRDAALFCALFASKAGVGEALRHMNRFGLLARWLPDWRPLVRFFQHNQYHYFTADEHTLTVIEKAEGLRHDHSTFGQAFRSLPRTDTLYFACLFHDITKPQRLDDHEKTGADLARAVLLRFGMGSIADTVSFLVRHHLFMEQVAFRRNLSDPITLREFSKHFSHPEQLRYLFVLTYADLASVNKNVLTDWKKTLLTELYLKALPFLEKKTTLLHAGDIGADALIRSMSKEDADAHGSLLRDDAYRRTFSRQEISDHIEALRTLTVSSTIVRQWSDATDLTLLTNDAPFVLARACGAMYANDANIIHARIFTRDDGVVIDSFRVVDSRSHGPLTKDRCVRIDRDIRAVLNEERSVADLLKRHTKRWKRRMARPNPNVRFDVTFQDHPHFTIIDVFGADAAGFLYTVSDAISRLGCSIHFAKIATRGDGIVDVFYVKGTDGRPISSEESRANIRSSLLDRIRSVYGEPGASDGGPA